ncbi:hypothetical protein SERLA73DRAFT_179546, partial [Serpula lacrymans var. lacrymans S7.3]
MDIRVGSKRAGHTNSKHVTLQENLGVLLYMCVTGLTFKHVGKCFQRANDTLSKYFKEILFAFSSAPIYTNDSIP